MNLKHYLKLGITFCIIFFAKTGNTQNFDNYPQAIEGENLSIEIEALLAKPDLLAQQIAASKRFADKGNATLDHVMEALLPFLPITHKK